MFGNWNKKYCNIKHQAASNGVTCFSQWQMVRSQDSLSTAAELILHQVQSSSIFPLPLCWVTQTSRHVHFFVYLFVCLPSFRIALLPNGTLTIANVSRRDAASYTCVAKNQFGTASTTGRLLITGEGVYLLLFRSDLRSVFLSLSLSAGCTFPPACGQLEQMA